MKSSILWQPSAARMEQSAMFRFMHAQGFEHYGDLYDWSIKHPTEYWQQFADFAGIIFHQPPTQILDIKEPFFKSGWFIDATLNYAEHALKRRDNHLAIIAFDEQGETNRLTYAELYQRVAQAQAYLQTLNIQPNDVVAAMLPNVPETLIFMLATVSLGAIWTSCSPDFGAQAIVDRFSQVAPNVFIYTKNYRFKGKEIDVSEKVEAVRVSLPDAKAISMEDARWQTPATVVHFEAVPFSHPAFILYSSGTTGQPKCIVHGHGGTLIQHVKELMLHTDLNQDDTLMYITSCGWMMWNWMASGLTQGATLVLYEGSPIYPAVDSLFDIIQQTRVTVFGTSAKYLSLLQKNNIHDNQHKLESVKTILSTGSPLLPETFDYVYNDLKHDVCLSSISGGTDIISCFALGNPILPVYRGELQCIGLGMAVEVWDGELVCTKPFPSMPLKFWNDPDDKRYKQAYFAKYPNVWTHGDYAMLTNNGGCLIFGRSDAVLNPGGVRIGTAEIYRQVEAFPSILESLAVALKQPDDESIILFVVMQEGCELTDELIAQIKSALKTNASPRHVPQHIIAAPALPKTVNGKLSEMAVTKIINGQEIDNADALANPECLDFFRTYSPLIKSKQTPSQSPKSS